MTKFNFHPHFVVKLPQNELLNIFYIIKYIVTTLFSKILLI